ncbi:MAG: FMN-binding protein [Bdellovibrionota bacterium]
MRRLGFLAITLGLAFAAKAGAITYLSQEEALALAFPEGSEARPVTLLLDAAGRERYFEALDVRPPEGEKYEAWEGIKDGVHQGYAFILTEKSRYRPITFLVAVDPEGKVRRVDVMVYREPRGGEVRQQKFLDQYKGQDGGVQLGRDLVSISGATVSAQVMTFGVNKALFLAKELRLRNLPPVPASAQK